MPRLVLTYPNGRTHEVDYEGDGRFDAGSVFELYGRTWRVTGLTSRRGYGSQRIDNVVVCRPLTASPLPRSTQA